MITTEPAAATEPVARAGRREWIALAVLLLPLLLVSMDVSVLYFAVPFIARDLQPTATQQLWIFDVYGFVLAGLLLTMGAVGDRIGRRRLLLIGAAGFSLASVAAAYSGSAGMLIAARAVLGIAGATLMPSTLALIRTMFTEERQRGKAIAIWTATMTGGVALGPVLSGVLLEHFWWGSVFLINLPAMALLLILGPSLLPEHRTSRTGGFDLASSTLSLAAVLSVIYGIKEWAANGFAALDVGYIVVGLVLGTAFLRRQRSAEHPMLDRGLFRRPGFGAGVACNVVAMFALVGNAVFITQYLQSVLGMSPLRAALWSIVPSVAVGAAAPAAAVLGQRFGRTTIIAGGFLLAGCGFAVLATAPARHGLITALIGAGLLAVGLVVVLTLVTELAMIAIAPARAGAATAVLETGSEFGGALGIAVLGSIGAAVYRSHIMTHLPAGLDVGEVAASRRTLAGATVTARHLPHHTGGPLLVAAREAFTAGMHTVYIVAAVLMVAAAAVAALSGARAGAQAGTPAGAE